MALYPSLEDMNVDRICQAQNDQLVSPAPSAPPVAHQTVLVGTLPNYNNLVASYPELHGLDGHEDQGIVMHHTAGSLPLLATTGGGDEPPAPIMQLRPAAGGGGTGVSRQVSTVSAASGQTHTSSPLSGRLPVRMDNAVRSATLRRADAGGKFGLALCDVCQGVFVNFVRRDSPAAGAKLHAGDQLLQIAGKDVAEIGGAKKCMAALKKVNGGTVELAWRDRPFERTITLHKDSGGGLGFNVRDGHIVNVARRTSAARNGLLPGHHVVEVNGKNVLGMDTKQIKETIKGESQTVTLTIIPSFFHQFITKKLGDNLVKEMERKYYDEMA